MRHLLIVAHPPQQSFTKAVAQAYANALEARGHDIVVRDLYRLRFNPVLSAEELLGPEPPKIPKAVQREQEHIERVRHAVQEHWGELPAARG